MKCKNIVLIGFMGSGKSRTGKLLARKLKRKFVDTDALIAQKEKMSIQEIFKTRGEAYFRGAETEMIQQSAELCEAVISAGGGAVLRKKNARALKKNSTLVWLKVSPQTVLSRVGGAKSRPLLSDVENKKDVCSLLEKREPVYRSICDVEVSTDGKTPEQVAEEIIKIIRQQATGNRQQGRC